MGAPGSCRADLHRFAPVHLSKDEILHDADYVQHEIDKVRAEKRHARKSDDQDPVMRNEAFIQLVVMPWRSGVFP